MADSLVEVAVRVYADFAEHATLAEVLAVIGRCRNDLDTPSAAAFPNWSNDSPGRGSPTGSNCRSQTLGKTTGPTSPLAYPGC
jgi:hypothetical protein